MRVSFRVNRGFADKRPKRDGVKHTVQMPAKASERYEGIFGKATARNERNRTYFCGTQVKRNHECGVFIDNVTR